MNFLSLVQRNHDIRLKLFYMRVTIELLKKRPSRTHLATHSHFESNISRGRHLVTKKKKTRVTHEIIFSNIINSLLHPICENDLI